MKTNGIKIKGMKTNDETMAIFHIGRGGRFNNAGHLEFLEIGTIADAERRLGDDVFYHDERAEEEESLKELRRNGSDADEIAAVEERLAAGDYRAPYYTDCAGNEVGEVGGGRYDFDGQYDALYCARLDDLTDAEKAAICAGSQNIYGGGTALFAECAEQGTAEQLSRWINHDDELARSFDAWTEAEGLDADETREDECELHRFAEFLRK